MQFGLVVTDDGHREAALACLEQARTRDWQCRCFFNDRGALLLMDPGFIASEAYRRAEVAVCELSIERYAELGLSTSSVDPGACIGGQYQDAELVRNCDRVLVL